MFSIIFANISEKLNAYHQKEEKTGYISAAKASIYDIWKNSDDGKMMQYFKWPSIDFYHRIGLLFHK